MRQFCFQIGILTVLFSFAVGITLVSPSQALAVSASELQAQIDAHNAEIKQIQADIAKYQKELDALGTKKGTLQSAIDSLALSQKQLASQISVTQNKIATANLTIQELTLSIGDKEEIISSDQSAIGKMLRDVAQTDSTPLVAQMLTSSSLSDAWKVTDEAVQLNKNLGDHITELQNVKTALSSNRDEVSTEKAKLVSLANDLATQKRSVDANKAAQQTLLTQTKNQEASYQKLLAQKQAAEQASQSELADLAAQLDLIVHPGSLPKVGSGVLHWPFSLALMQSCAARKSVFGNSFCITQYFGDTPFSTANPQIYNGHGHNAIDIGVPIGTPVEAALSGTVLGTGNTDLVRGCLSFGKWVMIKHGNGLNTLYAHLSVIDVAKGQTVTTGQTIGLSGMTGYATGPHLHFGVYASEGTEIMTLGQFRGATSPCANATMPVATLSAYLNPLSYL